MCGSVQIEDIVKVIKLIFGKDVKFKIIECLCKKAATLRELAKCVGIAPKNLKKYLNELESKGIVTKIEVSGRFYVYMLRREYEWLKEVFEKHDS